MEGQDKSSAKNVSEQVEAVPTHHPSDLHQPSPPPIADKRQKAPIASVVNIIRQIRNLKETKEIMAQKGLIFF